MHPHCYFWTGVGDDRRNEAERGPPPPSGDPGPFLASPLPPMRTCEWLLNSSPATASTSPRARWGRR